MKAYKLTKEKAELGQYPIDFYDLPNPAEKQREVREDSESWSNIC